MSSRHIIQVVLTAPEKRTLAKAAKASELSLSAYSRQVLAARVRVLTAAPKKAVRK
jgi:hypothetical protein